MRGEPSNKSQRRGEPASQKSRKKAIICGNFYIACKTDCSRFMGGIGYMPRSGRGRWLCGGVAVAYRVGDRRSLFTGWADPDVCRGRSGPIDFFLPRGRPGPVDFFLPCGRPGPIDFFLPRGGSRGSIYGRHWLHAAKRPRQTALRRRGCCVPRRSQRIAVLQGGQIPTCAEGDRGRSISSCRAGDWDGRFIGALVTCRAGDRGCFLRIWARGMRGKIEQAA